MDKYEKGSGRPEWAKRLPTLEVLDYLSYRLVALVFPLWTFAVIAGAIWAESAWGRYWGWDPKETWAFITWVANPYGYKGLGEISVFVFFGVFATVGSYYVQTEV